MNILMRVIIFTALVFSINAVAIEDDASVSDTIEESFLSGEIATITYNELTSLGVAMEELEADKGMIRLKVSATDKLSSLIESNEVNVYFSLLDGDQLVTLMPRYEANRIEFTVSCKYALRITISSKHNFNSLKEGVVYSYNYK